MESADGGKSGIVLAGGGARAAYQVGVLAAIKEILPDPKVNPFPIICGTSAGAVNAGALAVYADDFGHAVDNLLAVWRNFAPHHVYRADFTGATANSLRWFSGFLFGAFVKNKRISLLDNRPLESLLSRRLDFSRIASNIACGALDAVAITCSGYTSGQSCSFFEGADRFEGWQRSQRIGIKTRIAIEHLMASSALPFVFPPLQAQSRVLRRRLHAPDRAREPRAAPRGRPRDRRGHGAHPLATPRSARAATSIPRSRRSRATS